MDKLNPSYYKNGTIETYDFIESNDMNFAQGNIIKYVTRYKYKNGLEDLEKAEWYLVRLIANERKKLELNTS